MHSLCIACTISCVELYQTDCMVLLTVSALQVGKCAVLCSLFLLTIRCSVVYLLFFFEVAYLPVLCFLHVAHTTTYLVVVSCTVAHSPRAGSIAYPPVLFFHSTWCCFVIISYPVSYLLVLCSAYLTFLLLYSFNSHITTRSDVMWCGVG